MTTRPIVIIPFLHGKLTAGSTLIEPDIDAILERWLERRPEFRGRDYHIIRARTYLQSDDVDTNLVRVSHVGQGSLLLFTMLQICPSVCEFFHLPIPISEPSVCQRDQPVLSGLRLPTMTLAEMDYCRKIRLDFLQRVPEQAVMAAVFVMLKYMIR